MTAPNCLTRQEERLDIRLATWIKYSFHDIAIHFSESRVRIYGRSDILSERYWDLTTASIQKNKSFMLSIFNSIIYVKY
jgi:hypothetical protein